MLYLQKIFPFDLRKHSRIKQARIRIRTFGNDECFHRISKGIFEKKEKRNVSLHLFNHIYSLSCFAMVCR